MAGGYRKDHDCHRLKLILEAETNPVVEVIFLMLFAFANLVSLPFVVQFQTVKNLVKQLQATQKFNNRTTTQVSHIT